ncbi:MAG: VOC family protein [bacterium]
MPVKGPYNHIHLISADPEAAADWCAKPLGADIFRKEELRGSQNIRLTLGEARLYIRGKRDTDNIASPDGVKRYGIDHFCLSVEDIEGMLRHVEENGGTVSEPLFLLPSGNRAAYVQGPDGVQIELIEPASD